MKKEPDGFFADMTVSETAFEAKRGKMLTVFGSGAKALVESKEMNPRIEENVTMFRNVNIVQ